MAGCRWPYLAGAITLVCMAGPRTFAALCSLYRQVLDGQVDSAQTAGAIGRIDSNIRLSDGFLTGDRGVDWSGTAPMS